MAHHGGDHPGDTRHRLQENYTTETNKKRDLNSLFRGEKIRLNVSISTLFAFISMAIFRWVQMSSNDILDPHCFASVWFVVAGQPVETSAHRLHARQRQLQRKTTPIKKQATARNQVLTWK